MYPGSGIRAGFSALVMVSPTFTSLMLLILAVRYPTSPADNDCFSFSCGVFICKDNTSYTALVFIILILSPTFIVPFTTRSEITTPRYASYIESNIRQLNLSSVVLGQGIFSTTLSSSSFIPIPSFALHKIISSSLNPKVSCNSLITRSTSAFGKSILFNIGIISKLLSSARYKLARVCASIP